MWVILQDVLGLQSDQKTVVNLMVSYYDAFLLLTYLVFRGET